MKKWKEIKITIRAAIIGGFIALLGPVTIFLIQFSASKKSEKQANISVEEIARSQDSLEIVNHIKVFYDLKKVKVKKLRSIELDNDTQTNEYIAVYESPNLNRAFYDIYYRINDHSWNCLYHDEYVYDFRTYENFKINDKPYLLKAWNQGSGSFLSFEVYRLMSKNKLNKIYEIPDSIDTFQGEVFVIDNEVFFSLAGKRYRLVEGEKNKLTIRNYPERLRLQDIQNTEHLLTINAIDSVNLEMFFGEMKIKFKKNIGDSYLSIDTLEVFINDVIWIDDNSDFPAGLRIFEQNGIHFNDGFFNNIILTKEGIIPWKVNYGYGKEYELVFNVINERRWLDN